MLHRSDVHDAGSGSAEVPEEDLDSVLSSQEFAFSRSQRHSSDEEGEDTQLKQVRGKAREGLTCLR